MSSAGVNGGLTRERPFTETDEPAPASPYAVSKLRSERGVIATLDRSGNTSWVILRPPLVYGPRAPGNFGRLVAAVERGWIIPVGGITNSRSLIGLGNLLELVTLCLDCSAADHQLFLVADGQDVSTPDLVRHIATGLGKTARMISVPEPLLRVGAGMLGRSTWADSLCGSLRIDASKARRLLGWAPGQTAFDGIRQAARESRTTA
jgi:nucleoside-diphosphate-sugar epimerase